MQTILMSIHPKWCERIFNGEKTIEVRKSAPKPPFKVVVYCTKDKQNTFLRFWNKELQIANGKVIGEFICDKVDTISVHNDTVYSVNNLFADKLKNMCLTVAELKEYLGAKNNGYAIGITAPKLYDKPKELGEFRTVRFVRGYHKKNETMIERLQNSKRVEVTYVSKAPQNYMRIEEV